MRKRILFITMLLVAASATAGWAGAKLVVSENNWDFGDVPNVGTVSHSFKLTNAGDEVLKISSVQASCGCTSTKLENKDLNAGETTTVTVTFNNSSFPAGGRFTKNVSINTETGPTPVTNLSISATVNPGDYGYVTVFPKVLVVMENEKAKGSWKTLRIENKTALTQRIRVIEKAGIVKKTKLTKGRVAPGTGTAFQVRLDPVNKEFPPSSVTLSILSKEGERRISLPVVPPEGAKPQERMELN